MRSHQAGSITVHKMKGYAIEIKDKGGKWEEVFWSVCKIDASKEAEKYRTAYPTAEVRTRKI